MIIIHQSGQAKRPIPCQVCELGLTVADQLLWGELKSLHVQELPSLGDT